MDLHWFMDAVFGGRTLPLSNLSEHDGPLGILSFSAKGRTPLMQSSQHVCPRDPTWQVVAKGHTPELRGCYTILIYFSAKALRPTKLGMKKCTQEKSCPGLGECSSVRPPSNPTVTSHLRRDVLANKCSACRSIWVGLKWHGGNMGVGFNAIF